MFLWHNWTRYKYENILKNINRDSIPLARFGIENFLIAGFFYFFLLLKQYLLSVVLIVNRQ